MKAILLSIKPKWVVKILKGEKTIEVRKVFPKDYKGWVYIYCTKSSLKVSGKHGYKNNLEMMKTDLSNGTTESTILNGKVVARFWCDEVETIYNIYNRDTCDRTFDTNSLDYEELQKQSCVEDIEFEEYLLDRDGYAIHISNLEIFDKPKELGEFKHLVKYRCNNCPYKKIVGHYACMDCKAYISLPLTKAPQNYMFIEVEE